MNTRRTAWGRYVFVLSSSASSSSHRSTPYASMSSNVWPSTPGAPPLVGTQPVGELQDVLPVHLVVQGIEPIAGRFLRFGMQRPPGASEPSVEVLGSSPISRLSPLRTLALNSGPFPPPALPGFSSTTGLSATPGGPACPSRASGWRSRPPPPGASRVASDLLLQTCRRHYPGGIAGSVVRSSRPSDGGLPHYVAGRLPHQSLSRPAQRSLTLRPACSRSRQDDPLPSKASGGFVTSTAAPIATGWSDQLPGGNCTH